MLDIDTEISYSECNYTSANKPFFAQNKSDDNTLKHTYSVNLIELYTNHLTELDLDDNTKKFYIKYQIFDRELYIGKWTFFSIDQIIIRNQNIKNDIFNSIDIAFRYLGMGHIKVLTYNKKNKNFIYRQDGGSNDFDRLDNYDRLKNYNIDPEKYLNMYTDYEITTFAEFLSEIQKRDEYLDY